MDDTIDLPAEINEALMLHSLAKAYGKLPSEVEHTATITDLECYQVGVEFERLQHRKARFK